ncbi:Clp protease ClpP [Corynebacterium phoceense]|uniref:ATP-dependent Clp protease proteolytic subunit n=1 Tax=Corynebacterium phoceense TaxID=1686286 RepID=A0A540R759_9CORY|nr:head maturation protease, ClpP-related [Corynebacterium phoceense]TQE43579.1 Clp protease ClpP [Corynebacterium phoceense]
MNDLMIYGDIGGDNTAAGIEKQLASFNGEPIRVRINSDGGQVYEGIAILNALRGYAGEVTVVVESRACSAASFIAVGCGGRVIMRPNAELMIHKASADWWGNADDLEKARVDLERQDVKIANIYAGRAGGTADEWLERMRAETWYTAQEALDAGLVDAIEDAKAPAAATNLQSRMVARFKYANRAAAPPPPSTRSESGEKSTTPSNGQKGEKMNILDQLAQELGKKPEDVRDALSGFFNEVVQVSSEVDVTYPEATAIAPTEKVVVEPVIGGENGEPTAVNAGALGLTFAVKTAPDGWTVTVDEATGVLTVTAPSGVEVGATAEATVSVNGTVDVAAGFVVRSLSDDGEQTTDPAPSETPPEPGNAADTVIVPRAHFDYLNRVAANFAEAQAKLEAQEHEKTVDQAIAEGRFAAANRAKALADLARDPSQYAATWGALPKGTIPVAELGNAGTAAVKTAMAAANDPRKGHTTREELMERAKARAAKKEGK